MMNRKIAFFGLILPLFVFACVNPAVTVSNDSFEPDTKVDGIAVYEKNDPTGASYLLGIRENYVLRYWKIRSWVNKKDLTVKHQLYVTFMYQLGKNRYHGNWNSFKYALDDHGKQLVANKLDFQEDDCLDVNECMVREHVGIDLSDADLRAHLQSGYKVEVQSRSSLKIILTMTPDMIRQQLEAVDKLSHSAKQN